MHEVLVENRAQRNLKRLSREILERVVRAVRGLANNPRPKGCRKIVGAQNDWRIRVGEYRVIYEIDDVARVVRVMYVRHRRDAYR